MEPIMNDTNNNDNETEELKKLNDKYDKEADAIDQAYGKLYPGNHLKRPCHRRRSR